MNRRHVFALLAAVALALSSVGIAQDSDKKEEKAERKSKPRLVKPWSDLNTLTDTQKDQIMRIHAEAVDAMNAIREKEEADIMALLTPENIAELDALKEKQKAEAKARRAAKKDAGDDQQKKN